MAWDTFYQTIQSLFGSIPVRVVLVILVAVILQLLLRQTIARIVRRVVHGNRFASQLDELKRENTLITILRTASAISIWVVAIILILWALNINIAALMTGAGLIGIIVGFGAQNAIRDFLAGIFIIAENQYRVGDIATLRVAGQDYSGVVEDITIRVTRLRDLDGNLHILQNGTVNAVTNLSFGYANVNVDISVSYEADINQVESVMNKVGLALQQDPAWKDIIFEPIQFLRVDGFEDSAVRIKALGKVEPAKQWDVAGEFRRRLKVAFEKSGITIPFPQLVVHRAGTQK